MQFFITLLTIFTLTWHAGIIYAGYADDDASTSEVGKPPDAATISLALEGAINRVQAVNRGLLTSRYGMESQKISLESARSEFELKIVPSTSIGISGEGSETDESVGAGIGFRKKFEWGTNISVTPGIFKNDEYASGIWTSVQQPLLRNFGKEATLDGIRGAEYSTRTVERSLYKAKVNTVLETVSSVYKLIKQLQLVNPGGCPRIAIFSKIKACEKNYRRHMVDIPRIIF